MSEAMKDAETETARAPFPLTCTGCGADIDAPNRYFTLGPLVRPPRAVRWPRWP